MMNLTVPRRSTLEHFVANVLFRDLMHSNPLAGTLAAFAALLASCTTDEANRYYSPVRYPERSPNEVAILRSRPDREFIVIADFQSRGETATAMQRKAAKIGADAVIVVFLGGFYSLNDRWANADSQSDSFSRITATAIKYK
jgi:adenine/guanine phosphoribosyltransferase-like PRPP-binding protein